MFTLLEQSPEFIGSNTAAREHAAVLCAGLEGQGEMQVFEPEHVFVVKAGREQPLFYLREGFIRIENNSRAIIFLEPGDLFGWGAHLVSFSRIIADSPVKLDVFSQDKFLDLVHADRKLLESWQGYLESQLHIFTTLFSQIVDERLNIEPEILYFEPGQPIVIQETEPDLVYTMLHGKADAYVGEIKVGDVLSGEIFGAMAATTHSRRSASVIANTRCVVSTLTPENFLALVHTHPNTLKKLIDSMARIIVSQNEKIIRMTT